MYPASKNATFSAKGCHSTSQFQDEEPLLKVLILQDVLNLQLAHEKQNGQEKRVQSHDFLMGAQQLCSISKCLQQAFHGHVTTLYDVFA